MLKEFFAIIISIQLLILHFYYLIKLYIIILKLNHNDGVNGALNLKKEEGIITLRYWTIRKKSIIEWSNMDSICEFIISPARLININSQIDFC